VRRKIWDKRDVPAGLSVIYPREAIICGWKLPLI